MSVAVPEFRTPVMTLVEASWEDPSGASQTVPARMEDKSAGGACIRVKTPIPVGAKLRIQWRFEQFSGITRYCRSEGMEYVVGIQRQAADDPVPARAVPKNMPPPEAAPTTAPSVSKVQIVTLPPQETTAAPPPQPAAEPPQEFKIPVKTELPATEPAKEAVKERKSMHTNWLDRAPWRSKPDAPSVAAVENGEARGKGNSNAKNDKENPMSHITQPSEKASIPSAREVPNFQVELLPMEDIYRVAGIMNPRKGYSINKVVEMLHSQHICGLSQEMKRAAVLMALDAAGVSLDQLQHDAKARQDALDSHEADQRTQVEAEWARKAEEVIQMQAELESIKAHYTARISRNLEGVAREKATFNAWLGTKQQETQSMSEAVDLCLKAPVPAPASKPESISSPSQASRAAAVGTAANATQESRSDAIH
jgi:hypothetical protein